MKKLVISILILMFFMISCSSSKKTENNDTDILPDEDVINDDEAAESDEPDEELIELIVPCDPNPCENFANTDGTCTGKGLKGFECGCVEGYFWDGKNCIDPCDPNPCLNDKNSTGKCAPLSVDSHSCGCNEGYFWDEEKCADPCAGISCSHFEHAKEKCKADNAFIFSCDCEKGYYWWGKDEGCLKERPAAVNICTGQTKCYDNEKEIACPAEGEYFFGQDAQYARLGYCVPQSFSIDNSIESEPVVIDNNLGLMWQRKIPPVEELYIEDVLQYCDDLTYGGYDDWRLPSFEELITIADYGRYDPAVNTKYFPDSGDFWTSTENVSIEYFGDADIWKYQVTILSFKAAVASFVITHYLDHWIFNADEKYSYSFDIRCVRGESATKSEYYFISKTLGKNIIWNNINDLIFTKADKKQTWKEALGYCSKLILAGFSDWRMPNVKELAMSPWNQAAGYVAHTSTTRVDDFSFDYQLNAKDAEPEYTFCVANDPCGTELFWNGEKCSKNPCLDDPCQSVSSSSKVCIVVDEETYACGCIERYAWNSDKKECLRTCADYPCQVRDNSDHKCYPDDNYGYTCGCNENFYWNPEKYKCMLDCNTNPCKNIEYSDGECHENGDTGSYCGCVKGYAWFSYACVEDLCDPNPCENLENSNGTCTVLSSSYKCGCVEGYRWSYIYEECVKE